MAGWHIDRYRGLKLGLLGKDKKVENHRWVNRTPRYLRSDEGILKSKGWRTEAWSRVYYHVAEKRFSLPEACHAEELPYHRTNTQKEFRNEAYILKQRWRKKTYPVDGDRTVEDSVFHQAIKNLELKEPFEERKKAVKRAWELAAEGTNELASEDKIAETLTIEYPSLAKSYPNKKFSRHVVHGFLENPDDKTVPPQLQRKVRQARAVIEKPLVRIMKAKQEQNALLILQALNDSEAGFGEILTRTHLPKSTANKNISILKKSGLVEKRTGWHASYYLTTQGRLHLATIKVSGKETPSLPPHSVQHSGTPPMDHLTEPANPREVRAEVS
jgi:predicted transcriptional regulator